jgi:DNA-3-methyladenine glycosylase
MRARRGRDEPAELCSGPGKLTEALGVGLELNGADLCGEPFRLTAPEGKWKETEVVTGPRVGITKAVEHPWRFCVAGNRFVSRPLPRDVIEVGTG